MQLKHLGRIIRRNIWMILLATVLGASLAFAIASTERPVYSATAKMLYSSSGAGSPAELSAANAFLLERIATYESLVGTPLILDPVIEELSLDATSSEIADSVAAGVDGTGNVVAVTATSSEAFAAARLANTVSQALADEITSIQFAGANAAGAIAPQFEASMVDEANAPTTPVSPDIPLTTLVGALLGFTIGVLVAGIRAFTDPRVRMRDDVTTATNADVPVEGVARAASKTLVTVDKPADASTEAYRRLYAEMLTRADAPPKYLLVSSPRPQSTSAPAAANLAAVIAESGRTVTLVDADLRGGTLGDAFSATSGAGLADVLTAKAELSAVRRATTVPGLSLITSGQTSSAASALISSTGMSLVLDDLRGTSDVVVVSAPAVLKYADAVVLSEDACAAVLVVASGDTRKSDVADAYAMLENGGTPVGGVVLSSVPKRGPDARWR